MVYYFTCLGVNLKFSDLVSLAKSVPTLGSTEKGVWSDKTSFLTRGTSSQSLFHKGGSVIGR